MAKDTVTLALEGEVPLRLFVLAIGQWSDLLEALTIEAGVANSLDWIISGLDAGSAVATARAVTERPEDAERIVEAYERVGRALASDEIIPFPYGVRVRALAITSVIKGTVSAVRFETPDVDLMIYRPASALLTVRTSEAESVPLPRLRGAYGTVKGRIQTITSRNALRFTLYDKLHDKAVGCYLPEGRQDMIRDLWDRRALVEGWITRDPFTGRPLTIRRITSIRPLPDPRPGSFRDAYGAVPLGPDDRLPEDVIRELRDADG